MKKKVLSLLLALSLCLGMLPAQALAAEGELPEEAFPVEEVPPVEETPPVVDVPPVEDKTLAEDVSPVEDEALEPVLMEETPTSGNCGKNGADVTWTLADGTLTISGTGEMADYGYGNAPWNSNRGLIETVIIEPGVTAIGNYAFQNCSKLKEMVIRADLASIGNNAFNGCSGLVGVVIPKSVAKIGSYVFSNCSSLESVAIPEGVTTIASGTFYYCTNLISVTIPSSVTSIGDYAFINCSKLKEAAIPAKVTTIGSSAFKGCSVLENVVIPNNVTYIGEEAFKSCKALTSVTIPSGIKHIMTGTFSESGLTGITIPEGINTIHESAFEGCRSLDSVTLPNSLTDIRGKAFRLCTNLKSVTIPGSVTYFGAYGEIFSGCYSLTSVTIQAGATGIGYNAFDCCSNLTSVTIPSSVTSIGRYAFANCSNLANVMIPASVTRIDEYAFNSAGLTSVTVPGSVSNMGEHVFEKCANLTDAIFLEGVTSVAGYTFTSCAKLTNVTLPESVTSLGRFAFSGCSSLTNDAVETILEGITGFSSGGNIFEHCNGLTALTIPEGVTSIVVGMFSRCSNLTSVRIPSSAVSIGSSAFEWCTILENVTIPASVTNIDPRVFYSCPNLTEIYFGGSEEQLAVACKYPSWSTNVMIYYNCSSPDNFVPYEVTGGNIYFDKVTKAIVKCDANVTAADIPISIEGLPVEAIGSNAFKGHVQLTKVTIPRSVKTIWNSAFEGCTALTYAKIPGSVLSIGNRAFFGCTSLEKVQILDSVQSIGDSAFSGCSLMTLAILGKGISSIGKQAFQNCSNLRFIAIPSGVTEIKEKTFSGCALLDNIRIPGSVSSISSDAFDSCTGLYNVYYGGTKPEWVAIILKMPSTSASQYLEKACINTWGLFSFANIETNFFAPDSLFDPVKNWRAGPYFSHFETVLNQQYNPEISEKYTEALQLLSDRERSVWGGSCYGMAALEGMVNTLGYPASKIDGKAGNIEDVERPRDNSRVLHLFNYYYLSQYLPMEPFSTRYTVGTQEGQDMLRKLADNVLEGTPCLFGYFFNNSAGVGCGHAFTVEGGKKLLDGSYELVAQDNRFYGSYYKVFVHPDDPFDVSSGLPVTSKLIISSDFNACKVETPYSSIEEVVTFCVFSAFDDFMAIDPTGTAASTRLLGENRTADAPALVYYLPDSGDAKSFTFSESNGAALLSGGTGGDGAENLCYVIRGSETPAGMVMKLDNSGSVYTASGINGVCVYAGPKGMAAVSMKDANATATINLEQDTVTLGNNTGEFSIVVDISANDGTTATVSGTASQGDTVTVTANDNGSITLNAPESGTYEVTFEDDYGDEYTVPVTGGELVTVKNPTEPIPCDTSDYTAEIEWTGSGAYNVTLMPVSSAASNLTAWQACYDTEGKMLSTTGLTGTPADGGTSFSGKVTQEGTCYLFVVDGNTAPIIRKYNLTKHNK